MRLQGAITMLFVAFLSWHSVLLFGTMHHWKVVVIIAWNFVMASMVYGLMVNQINQFGFEIEDYYKRMFLGWFKRRKE